MDVELKPRVRPECPGLVFQSLTEHAEHLARHNPSPAQWTEAYNKIQVAKEKAKPKKD
jgi:hypothetical protein